MKLVINITFILMICSSSLPAMGSPASLPSWLPNECKLANLNELAESMREEGLMYQIQLTEGKEQGSGSESFYQVETVFDDANGCKGREMITYCYPLQDSFMVTKHILTQCDSPQSL